MTGSGRQHHRHRILARRIGAFEDGDVGPVVAVGGTVAVDLEPEVMPSRDHPDEIGDVAVGAEARPDQVRDVDRVAGGEVVVLDHVDIGRTRRRKGEDVGAVAANEHVMPAAAFQPVGLRTPVQRLVVLPPDDDVLSRAAVENGVREDPEAAVLGRLAVEAGARIDVVGVGDAGGVEPDELVAVRACRTKNKGCRRIPGSRLRRRHGSCRRRCRDRRW